MIPVYLFVRFVLLLRRLVELALPVTMAVALVACCATPAADESPTYNVTWTSALTCPADSVSHPCPYLTYSQLVTLNPVTDTTDRVTGASKVALTWWAADVPGDRGPVPDLAMLNADGSIGLVTQGDDGGERQAATLAPTKDGYAGDVSWLLFNVAGMTTFHIEATR